MLRALLPRFALVVVAVPLAFLAALFGAQQFGFDTNAVPGVAAAATFAAVALAPSHKNASVRAALLLLLLALFAGISALAAVADPAVASTPTA